ncbi:hypothetical protein KIPB_007867 [Kipferlia bialata]|uniref:Uncharacterized protein n=1 Tax=Kipferlia bialata TaxID=797122 RepID=A0A9K3GKE0_9EUKA|nr:hypothetical protein KIPB_007867 [Kipferlia bialata]|eukprot:g7867.t1
MGYNILNHDGFTRGIVEWDMYCDAEGTFSFPDADPSIPKSDYKAEFVDFRPYGQDRLTLRIDHVNGIVSFTNHTKDKKYEKPLPRLAKGDWDNPDPHPPLVPGYKGDAPMVITAFRRISE